MPTFQRWLAALVPIIFRVRTRRGLLTLTLTLQALVLAIGLYMVFQDVRHRVALRLQDRIVEQNIRTAESLAKTMDDLEFGPAYCGSLGRERAQKMIEGLILPANGFVCLLDEHDKIICHPKLRENPNLCGVNMHDLEVTTPRQGVVRLGDTDRTEIIAGNATFMDKGTHYLAAKYIDSMKARVVVQQPESGLLALGEAVASGTMLRAAGLGASTLVLTGAISFVLIRRHDRALESINRGLETEVQTRVRESLAARHSLILGLAKLAESRDTDTGEHLERISLYSELLANELRSVHPIITDHWIGNLRLASSLHDIGKVGIPDSVLLKPGRLDPGERAIMERHALIGAQTLLAVKDRFGGDELVDTSIEIALHHHEKWDGSGYPHGLRAEQIPLAARIVAVADVYDALTSERVYKNALPHARACEIIREGRAVHFDPDVVDAFERIADRFDEARARARPAFPLVAEQPPLRQAA